MSDNKTLPGINITITDGGIAATVTIVGAFITLWLGMGWI